MPRTWFVGAAGVGPPPARAGEFVVPLSLMARTLIADGGASPASLEALELEAGTRVFDDLARFVTAIGGDRVGKRWLAHRARDLSPALRRPDEAATGFANQALAFEVASSLRGDGPFEAWGVDPFQFAGLRAALGPVTRHLSPDPQAPGAESKAPRPSGGPGRKSGPCDILYLSLEPHVALQQDRVLGLLSEKYRIAAVGLRRSSWEWPAAAAFRPPANPPLVSYLRPADVLEIALGWAARRAFSPHRAHLLRWMPPGECARWLRSTWLRAAGVTDALARAIATHRPRLLIGTSLASGTGTVITACAAQLGVASLSLPTGADCLLPPYFDPADAGKTMFVLPGERIAERLRDAGVSGEQLLSCGWPELDSICDAAPGAGAALRAEFGFSPGRPLVVFFSSPSSPSDELVVPARAKRAGFESLARACQMENLPLAVKLHPRESDDMIEQMAAELSPPAPVFRDRLAALLQAADVVASLGSAVSFAGAVLGKTTVILEAGAIGRTAAIFASVGVGSQPRSLEELRVLLRNASRCRPDPQGEGLLGADARVAERVRSVVDRVLD